MSRTERTELYAETWEDRCDTRVWSGKCGHEPTGEDDDPYLCAYCGTIEQLDHEVGHEIFPHIKGATDSLY